jgi:SAM-dependent methyltransferase
MGIADMPERVTDDVFEDVLLASFYDAFNPWMACDDYYLNLARICGGKVLDIGCGTGMLACRIVEEGVSVTGVEPGEGMLRVARSRPGAERVTWIKARGQDLNIADRFALIYMTGHAFQALLSDHDAVGVLRAAARHLAPDGRFVFETREPSRRAWEGWTVENDTQTVIIDGHGPVRESNQARFDPRDGLVHNTAIYTLQDSGREVRGASRLRFIPRDHLAGLINEAGLEVLAWHGNWDGSIYTEESAEIIAVTRLARAPSR